MADKSAIEWTEATWNPVTGCSKVSPGCAHCYAETLTERFAGSPGWVEEHRPWTPENAGHNVRLHPDRLDQPLRWRRPRMVFVNSMSDLFHEQVPAYFIDEVFAIMAVAPEHTFQVLTKRPEEVARYFADPTTVDRVSEFVESLAFDPNSALPRAARSRIMSRANAWRPLISWPLPNVWLGVSIENARHTWRADVLREIPAAVRFISAEPLLGSLLRDRDGERFGAETGVEEWHVRGPLDLSGIDWLIVGGESGPHARPMDPEWARELRDACVTWPDGAPFGERTGPAFFFKQWGGRTPKANGRLLDGREWNEMPTARAEVTA